MRQKCHLLKDTAPFVLVSNFLVEYKSKTVNLGSKKPVCNVLNINPTNVSASMPVDACQWSTRDFKGHPSNWSLRTFNAKADTTSTFSWTKRRFNAYRDMTNIYISYSRHQESLK